MCIRFTQKLMWWCQMRNRYSLTEVIADSATSVR